MIPAAILADSPVVLEGVPDIQDVHSLIDILNVMKVETTFDGSTLTIDPTNMVSIPMPNGKIKKSTCFLLFYGGFTD